MNETVLIVTLYKSFSLFLIFILRGHVPENKIGKGNLHFGGMGAKQHLTCLILGNMSASPTVKIVFHDKEISSRIRYFQKGEPIFSRQNRLPKEICVKKRHFYLQVVTLLRLF